MVRLGPLHPFEREKGMSPEGHMDKAEEHLKKSAMVLTQAYSEASVDKAAAYARLAEAHLKAAQLLKDW